MPDDTGAGGALRVKWGLADGGQGRAVQDDTGDVEGDGDGDEEEGSGSGSEFVGVGVGGAATTPPQLLLQLLLIRWPLYQKVSP